MSYAVAGNKSMSSSWRVLRTQKPKKHKRGGKAFASSKSQNSFSSFWVLVKTISRWMIKILLVAAGAYGVYFCYHFFTTSPRFAISTVTLTGNHTLPEKELLEQLGPVTGDNIFLLNLESLSTKLAGHPWVQTVSVRKAFPQEVLVHVEERKPYARIKLDKIYIMDNFGVLLAPETPAYSDLPLIIHPPSKEETVLGRNVSEDGVVSSLKHIHYFNQLSFFSDNPIQSADIDGMSRITFTTRNGNLKIFMGLETIAQDFKNFMIVRESLEKDKKDIEHIDLSFKDKVVVKRKENA
jgi:cell division septal protein FtsQ